MYLFKSEVIQGRKGVILVVECEEIPLFIFSYKIELCLVVEVDLCVSLFLSLHCFFHEIMFKV